MNEVLAAQSTVLALTQLRVVYIATYGGNHCLSYRAMAMREVNVRDKDEGGLSWLGGHTGWWQVSREERYFCAELYRVVHGKEAQFVKFLNRKCEQRLNEQKNWELAYEVCFYRDWEKADYPVPDPELSKKRTIDLVLFSAAQIVLFEAKAQQSYSRSQLEYLKADRNMIGECIGCQSQDIDTPEILTAGIKSGRYDAQAGTLGYFDLCLNWSDLAEWCTWDSHATQVFKRADCVYGS